MCDAGVFAPVLSFQKMFEKEGVPITDDEARGPMGVHKRVNFLTVIFYQPLAAWSSFTLVFSFSRGDH